MAKKQPTISEEELGRRHARWMKGVDAFASIARFGVVGLFVWLCVHSMFYLPVAVSHGETTAVSVAQEFLVNARIDVLLAWGAGIGGIAYGLYQKRKRIEERGAKDVRISDLERQIDPGRTSSGMAPSGEGTHGGNQ